MTNEQTKQKPHPYSQVLQWVAKGKEIEVYHTDSGCYLQLDTNSILRIVLAGTDDKSYKQPQDFRLKPERHVHQDLIDAFESGAKIQYWSKTLEYWTTTRAPAWDTDTQYRIKPEPKPEVTLYGRLYLNDEENDIGEMATTPQQWISDNIKVVFCGDTHKIKSVEII